MSDAAAEKLRILDRKLDKATLIEDRRQISIDMLNVIIQPATMSNENVKMAYFGFFRELNKPGNFEEKKLFTDRLIFMAGRPSLLEKRKTGQLPEFVALALQGQMLEEKNPTTKRFFRESMFRMAKNNTIAKMCTPDLIPNLMTTALETALEEKDASLFADSAKLLLYPHAQEAMGEDRLKSSIDLVRQAFGEMKGAFAEKQAFDLDDYIQRIAVNGAAWKRPQLP